MMSTEISRIAVIGTGVIGASWAAYFLSKGYDVVASDPADGAERRLREAVDAAWPSLTTLGLADGASRARLTFAADPARAVAEVDFVQENGPEREDLKRALFAVLDEHAPRDAVIASSSSGILPSIMQQACKRHPERILIGHPFNPAHLIPLVEVVGGAQTSAEAVEAALAFYTLIGKRPIRLRQELPGHVTNRLQAALWREAYSLVERGVASVADIDTAISYGPGLRWALLGPLVNQHLSGGAGGLAHILEHLGPPTQKIMDDLGTPQLTPALASMLVAGVNDELRDIDTDAMVAQRDALLLELLARKASSHSLP